MESPALRPHRQTYALIKYHAAEPRHTLSHLSSEAPQLLLRHGAGGAATVRQDRPGLPPYPQQDKGVAYTKGGGVPMVVCEDDACRVLGICMATAPVWLAGTLSQGKVAWEVPCLAPECNMELRLPTPWSQRSTGPLCTSSLPLKGHTAAPQQRPTPSVVHLQRTN